MTECMEREGTFAASDGAALWERCWEPAGGARANLVLIHGYGEHCSRYDHVARVFSGAGIAVHAYDQRGFGHSPGKRGYIADYDTLLTDLDSYLAHIRPRLGGKPLFFMGHSMGGQVLAYYYITRRPQVRGLIFSSAFLEFADDVPRILVALSGPIGALLPWLPVGNVSNEALSRDPAVVAAADADPLSYHGRVLARTGAQFKRAIDRIREGIASIDPPLYIVHGTADRLVSPRGSRALHDASHASDKTLKLYEGGYHELWNDIVKEEVIAEMAAWLQAHLD